MQTERLNIDRSSRPEQAKRQARRIETYIAFRDCIPRKGVKHTPGSFTSSPTRGRFSRAVTPGRTGLGLAPGFRQASRSPWQSTPAIRTQFTRRRSRAGFSGPMIEAAGRRPALASATARQRLWRWIQRILARFSQELDGESCGAGMKAPVGRREARESRTQISRRSRLLLPGAL
jgi:hypothetical protein